MEKWGLEQFMALLRIVIPLHTVLISKAIKWALGETVQFSAQLLEKLWKQQFTVKKKMRIKCRNLLSFWDFSIFSLITAWWRIKHQVWRKYGAVKVQQFLQKRYLELWTILRTELSEEMRMHFNKHEVAHWTMSTAYTYIHTSMQLTNDIRQEEFWEAAGLERRIWKT